MKFMKKCFKGKNIFISFMTLITLTFVIINVYSETCDEKECWCCGGEYCQTCSNDRASCGYCTNCCVHDKCTCGNCNDCTDSGGLCDGCTDPIVTECGFCTKCCEHETCECTNCPNNGAHDNQNCDCLNNKPCTINTTDCYGHCDHHLASACNHCNVGHPSSCPLGEYCDDCHTTKHDDCACTGCSDHVLKTGTICTTSCTTLCTLHGGFGRHCKKHCP